MSLVKYKLETIYLVDTKKKLFTLYCWKSKVCAHIVNWTFFIAIVIMDGEYISNDVLLRHGFF